VNFLKYLRIIKIGGYHELFINDSSHDKYIIEIIVKLMYVYIIVIKHKFYSF